MKNIPKAVALHFLENEKDHEIFKDALLTTIETNAPNDARALMVATQFSREKCTAFYHYYCEEKKARIEIRASIKNKLLWNHKSALTKQTLSTTVALAMSRVNIHVLPTQEINLMTNELVRFNSLVNQIAKWVNTYKSDIDAIAVLTQLDELSVRFEDLTESLHKIATSNKSGNVYDNH
ncbi:hypothetical protein BCV08_11785 [Vibrio breoganii]|uniref:hypothetical protein n=1 Tax=Vibrio breoganii TaxID=553239 RepID=UPI000C823E71|nr:hypothetical protein [Vibrio breoganii]PMF92606.1 hypothetical protein BCV08_11785 [Vibrio breoganii]